MTKQFKCFYLTGGTALSFFFEHRFSEDLDFFTQVYSRQEPDHVMKFISDQTGFLHELREDQNDPKFVPMKVFNLRLKGGRRLKIGERPGERVPRHAQTSRRRFWLPPRDQTGASPLSRIMEKQEPTYLTLPNFSSLIEQAKRARLNAFSPYSKFKVGAAVLSKSGKIYSGCNVENASYGLTVCAERNAVAAMVAQGERKIAAIAIVTDLKRPASPCGACRQVIAEFGTQAKIILANLKGKTQILTLSNLLPFRFQTASSKT